MANNWWDNNVKSSQDLYIVIILLSLKTKIIFLFLLKKKSVFVSVFLNLLANNKSDSLNKFNIWLSTFFLVLYLSFVCIYI